MDIFLVRFNFRPQYLSLCFANCWRVKWWSSPSGRSPWLGISGWAVQKSELCIWSFWKDPTSGICLISTAQDHMLNNALEWTLLDYPLGGETAKLIFRNIVKIPICHILMLKEQKKIGGWILWWLVIVGIQEGPCWLEDCKRAQMCTNVQECAHITSLCGGGRGRTAKKMQCWWASHMTFCVIFSPVYLGYIHVDQDKVK